MYADYLKFFGVEKMEDLNTNDKFIQFIKDVEFFNDVKVDRFFFMDGHLYLCFENSVSRIGFTQVGLALKTESMIFNLNNQED